MVIYSVKSHRKIVHLTNCKVIRRIPIENRRTFDTVEEAFEHGYHLCNCCPAIAHRYRREKKAVDSFCKDNQLQLKLEDGAINIASPQDCWKIIVNGKNKNLFLYHKNSFEKKYEVVPSIVPGYHSQACHYRSILQYLKYIIRHDEFRAKYPCTKSAHLTKYIPRTYTRSWILAKYGEPWGVFDVKNSYIKIKGTKKYRKEQKKKKQQERMESIARVYALIDELAAK